MSGKRNNTRKMALKYLNNAAPFLASFVVGVGLVYLDVPKEAAVLSAMAAGFLSFTLLSQLDAKKPAPVAKPIEDDISDEEPTAAEETVTEDAEGKKKLTRAQRKKVKKADPAEIAKKEVAAAQRKLKRVQEQEAKEAEAKAKAAEDAKAKKKKKGKKGKEAAAAAVAAPADEDWEQQRSQIKKESKARAKETKRKQKQEEEADEEDNGEPKIADVQIEVKIPVAKRGAIIGKEGATLKLITTTANVNITMPTKGSSSEVATIKGPKENVEKARKAIVELMNLGHSSLTHPDIGSHSINCPKNLHSTILGHNGSTIRELQKRTGARISMPQKDSKSIAINISGELDQIHAAEKAIQELITQGFCELLHEGYVRAEVPFEAKLLPALFGQGGSKIRSLQDRFSCKIQTNDPSVDADTIIVTGPGDQVDLLKEELATITDEREEVPIITQDAAWGGVETGADLDSLTSWD